MNGRYFCSVWLVTCVVIGLTACSQKKGQDIESLLASATSYEQTGQYRAAVIQIKNAIQSNPQDPRGHVAFARALIATGQFRAAIKELDGLKDKTPDSVITLTKAYLKAGKVRSANDFLDTNAGILKNRQVALDQLRGDLAMAEGDTDTAMQQYQSVLASDSANTEAQLGLARVEAALGQSDKAEATLAKVLKANPDNAKALLFQSVLRTKQGDLTGAEKLLTEAAQAVPAGDVMTPLRYSVLLALQDNLTKQGKPNEALFYSHLIAEATPDGGQVQNKMHDAVDAVAHGDFTKARKLLKEVQAQAPDSAQAGTMLGVVDYLEGNNKAAVKQFRQFVDPEVASSQALQMYAMAELKLNHPQAIIKQLKQDIDYNKDGRVVALYGIALVSAGDKASGEKYLKKAVSLDPGNGRLRMPLVKLFNSEGKRDLALEQLRAAYKAKPKDPLVQTALVRQMLRMGDHQEAATTIEDLRKSWPDSEPTQLLVADFYLSQKESKKAQDVLKKLPKLNESPKALGLMARIELQAGQYESAAKRYRRIITLDANDSLAYKGLITAYELEKKPAMGVNEVAKLAVAGKSDVPALVLSEYYGRRGNFDEAFSTLKQVAHPKSPRAMQLDRELRVAKARQQSAKGDFDEARQTIMAGLSSTPDNPQLLTALTYIELGANKPAEATKILSRLRKAAPDNPRVDVVAGDVALQAKDYDSARRDYAAVWKAAPSDGIALKRLGVLLKMPDVSAQEMKAFFDDWDKRVPGSVASRVARAGQAMAVGDVAAARDDYESLLKDHPNTPIALNNLAWIYGQKELDKALSASKRAWRLAPKSGEIADTYGWFLYKSGDTKKARQILAEATRLSPDNAEIRKHLSEVSGTPKDKN